MRFCLPGTINLLSWVTMAFCFDTVFATQTLAQSSGSRPTPLDRRVEQIERQREQKEREALRDGPHGKPQGPAGQRPSQAITLQVKQDFERLQAVYNDIVLALSAGTALDHKFISEATGEIKKCAGRLKKNLALPEPEKDESDTESEVEEGFMRPWVQKLCQHIVSFVTNPLFEASGGLDVEQATKAGKDLGKIIELSEKIGTSANKLSGAKK